MDPACEVTSLHFATIEVALSQLTSPGNKDVAAIDAIWKKRNFIRAARLFIIFNNKQHPIWFF